MSPTLKPICSAAFPWLIEISRNPLDPLRNNNDLNKIESSWGFSNLSLVNLDLRRYKKLLDEMPFDSLTKWPEPNKLPARFNPADLLEKGKYPGLGIKKLHQQGIDGRGIGIAIIDQPLLKNHIEYADRLVRYEQIDVKGVDIQMHGPPVCSIAVGKTCGVAPKASLYYYAVPPWKWLDNKPWAHTLRKIIKKKVKETDDVEKEGVEEDIFKSGDFFNLNRKLKRI